LAYGNATQFNKGRYDDVLGANLIVNSVAMPNARVLDEVIVFRKHPVATCLGAKTAIVDEKDQVSPFSIASLKLLQRSLVRRCRHKAV
jgi:hypothetical protein